MSADNKKPEEKLIKVNWEKLLFALTHDEHGKMLPTEVWIPKLLKWDVFKEFTTKVLTTILYEDNENNGKTREIEFPTPKTQKKPTTKTTQKKQTSTTIHTKPPEKSTQKKATTTKATKINNQNEKKTIEIEGAIETYTDLAVLINFGETKQWIPKSTIRDGNTNKKDLIQMFTIDEWILKKNGLIA